MKIRVKELKVIDEITSEVEVVKVTSGKVLPESDGGLFLGEEVVGFVVGALVVEDGIIDLVVDGCDEVEINKDNFKIGSKLIYKTI